jgi:hypothetical protein
VAAQFDKKLKSKHPLGCCVGIPTPFRGDPRTVFESQSFFFFLLQESLVDADKKGSQR